jgi:signal transduction histidine kinase
VAERSRLREVLAGRWLDPALAIGFTLIALIELFVAPDMPRSPLAPVLILPLCGTLVARRSRPVVATAAAVAALLAAAVADFDADFPPASALPVMSILSYSCGAHASFRRGLLAVIGLVLAAQVVQGFSEFPNVEISFGTLAPWWVGWEVGRRRRVVRALDERTRELEVQQDAFVELSLRRERARIARELHDIVAHHVAVIVVQAGAGRMAVGTDETPASERLATIRQSSDQALAEMSRLVDLIHADPDSGDSAADRIRALVSDARAAGLLVDVTPPPGEIRLTAEIEDDVLRVIQEGLTNVVKHAPGARVSVRLDLTDDSLDIEIRDCGGGAESGLAQTGAGLGLTGMRERIEALGGSLEAGPRDGGWRVHARLPRYAAAATTPVG